MDFLRLHLPGLHQAIRGALDSFSTLVSYFVGDAVPTVERETQAAEELREVATAKLGKVVEEEAQEALEDLAGGPSERVGGPREARRCQEGSLAGEQTWEWGAESSSRSTAGQDTGAKEATMAPSGQEPYTPLDAGMRSEEGLETHGDRSSGAQESREPNEEEVSKGEPLSTWEQQQQEEKEEEEEEEEEEVRATEPGIASGVESQLTWHEEPEGKAGTGGQKMTEGSKETEWVSKEAAAETKGPGATEADREERVLLTGGPSAKAQGTQGPGTESEDWAMWDREEAQTTSGKEEADLPGVKETEHGPIWGENIPETTGRIWVLEETCRGDLEEEVGDKRKAETKLQTQALETERTSEREAVGRQETGGCFEGKGRRDSAIRADETYLEQQMQAEKALRGKESCFWATEAMLALAKEVEDEPDLEATPKARPEELFLGERNEEAQIRQEVLEVKVTEDQEPEPIGDPQNSTWQPEEDQEKPGRIPSLSKQETLQSLKEYPRHVETSGAEVEAWENWQRRDSKNTQMGKTEPGEEGAAVDQAVEAQAKGSQEPELPEVPGWGTEEGLASQAVNQELKGSQGAEVATGRSQGGLEVRESRAGEEEAAVPWEEERTSREGWRLEEAALGLRVSEDMETSSLNTDIGENQAIPGIRTARAGEGPQWEAVLAWEGEFRRSWHSEGQVDARRGTELEEVADGENGGGLEEGSTEEEVAGHSGQTAAGETREEEQAEVGGSTLAEGSSKIGDATSGSRAVRTEETTVMVETEGLLEEQMVLEAAAWGEQVREAQRLQDVENVMSGGQRPEIQETDPEGLEDTPGQERQPAPQIPAEVLPGPSETAEGPGGATGDAHSSWSEALLPGSLLDVSVPRSRVLLSRSSSQRRSRPSFHRTPVPEQQHNSPSAQPQEELPAPEQSPLQPEEAPQPSTPRPGRRPPGHGFGLAHPGMMQELQARLGRPKPQ